MLTADCYRGCSCIIHTHTGCAPLSGKLRKFELNFVEALQGKLNCLVHAMRVTRVHSRFHVEWVLIVGVGGSDGDVERKKLMNFGMGAKMETWSWWKRKRK